MGKNRKSELEIFDPNLNDVIRIDSMEEWQVYNWVLELFELGVLKKYEYQPPEFNLTPKYQFIPLFNNPKKATTELKMISKSKKQKKKKTESDTHHK